MSTDPYSIHNPFLITDENNEHPTTKPPEEPTEGIGI